MLAGMRNRADTEGVDRAEQFSFHVSDVDEARALCAEFFYDVDLRVLDPGGTFSLAADVVQIGPVTAGDLRFGVDVAIRTPEMDAYHVNLPISGHLQTEHDGTVMTASSRRAAVYHPVGPARACRWPVTCRNVCVKLEPAAVEAELSALLGHPVRGPVRLGPSLDTTCGPGLTWARMLNLLRRESDNPSGLLAQPLFAERFWRNLVCGLLLSVDHQYAHELTGPATPVRPRTVRRAMEVIEADPARPLTTADLARMAGASVRSLQEGFRQHVGLSPMAYLQRVRLSYAHEELRHPRSGRRSVAAIAHAWGFGHLGRFAAAYRERYGVSPSATLREGDDYSPGSP
jgi:AraC-like DNA-binding protein